MAHHRLKILNEVLSPDYLCLIDSSGQPVVPSHEVYQKISDNLSNDEYKISPKHIYTILKNNRYETWHTILAFHEIEVRDDSKLDDSELDAKRRDSKLKDEISFSLNIPYKTWAIMTPEELRYKDRVLSERNYTVLTRKVWTDTLYELISDQTDLPCTFSFRRCKMTESGIFLKVSGTCGECGSSFSGMIANKPPPRRDVTMDCFVENFDDSVLHRKKRQLKGQRRIEISKQMVDSNILPCIWRRNEADKLMEFGGPEPAHLPKTSVLRKAKQEREDIQFGVKGKDPMDNLRNFKYGRHAGSIHSIGLDPVYVHYWTPHQVAIYLENFEYISVDATGSLIRKLKMPTDELCPHIYLYQIVTETAESKVPVFQMLSASQNTNSICFWLNEIIRIGSKHRSSFPLPKQVVCDFDKALMGALARVFGQCRDLKDYLSRCFNCITRVSDQLPSCLLRLDVSHYVHMICRWDVLSKIHPLARTLYIMVMSYLTKVTDFDEYKDIVKSVIILCNSEEYGDNIDGFSCLAQEAFQRLRRIVKGDPNPTVSLVMDHIEASKAERPQAAKTEDEIDNDVNNQDDIPQTVLEWAVIFFEECEEAAKKGGQSERKGEDANPYFAPAIGQKIKSLLHYFPLYTRIMPSIFGFGTPTATSSAVEGEFNDLKNRLFHAKCGPVRIDKFVNNHLLSFSGRMKLAKAEVYASSDMNNSKSANLHKEEATEVHNTQLKKVGKTGQAMAEETQPVEIKKRGAEKAVKFETKKTPEVSIYDVEAESNPSDRRLLNLLNDASPSTIAAEERREWLELSDVESARMVMPAVTIKDSYSDGDDELPKEELHELRLEHNWRNKNEPPEPTKRRKRTYLDPHPELRVATFSKRRKVAMSLLPNGNLCPSFMEKRKRFIVMNTCGFDSIQQLLVAACIHDTFNEVVQTASSKVFQFTKNFTAKGPSPPIYKERARLLSEASCFIEEKIHGIVTINALSNICNLCEWIFKEEPSFETRKECLTCQNSTSKSTMLVQLDFKTIQAHGYGKLEDAIKHGEDMGSERDCHICNGKFRTTITYRPHLFIECIGSSDSAYELKSFPININLNESVYSLVGIVHFRPGRTVTGEGHYSAYAKYGDNWEHFDDLCAKSKRVSESEKINPVFCLYVAT